MSFVRQFIHYDSNRLSTTEEKKSTFSCQDEEGADDCERTCKAKGWKGQSIRNAEFPPLTCDIINNNCDSGVTNVARNQAPEPLLTCCVP